MIEFHDPRAEIGTPVEPYTLGIDLQQQADITVAMLANGFPDSERFLNKVADVLGDALPHLRFHHLNKGNASIMVNDEMLQDINQHCQAAIAAYGH